MKLRLLPLCCITGVLLYGCSSAGYYAQSVQGQLEVWRESKPIPVVLDDPDVPEEVKRKLELAMQVRRFAVEQLHLPDNDSYTEYVDLNRPYMVWSVFVAPEFSLQPIEWCFVVVGCVNYRGYFKKPAALQFAQKHEEQGYDVYVGGVPAYSTLGWFDDPVPNTVLNYTDEDFAGLILHELAHQVAFVKGDTVFNESFATAVEQIGVERWLTYKGDRDGIAAHQLRWARNQEIVDLILRYRSELGQIYRKDSSDSHKKRVKEALIEELRETYHVKVAGWGAYTGYKYWFEQPINNAKLASVATYHDLVPGFKRLLREQDGDLPRFYEIVKQLAEESKSYRWQKLGVPHSETTVH